MWRVLELYCLSRMCVCMYVCMYSYVCTYVHMYVCMYVCMYVGNPTISFSNITPNGPLSLHCPHSHLPLIVILSYSDNSGIAITVTPLLPFCACFAIYCPLISISTGYTVIKLATFKRVRTTACISGTWCPLLLFARPLLP